MTMNPEKVLNWLKEFKHKWLLQNILNDNHLINLISNKIHELEELLIENHQDENGIITIENEDQYGTPTNPEPVVSFTEQHLSSNIQNSIENENNITTEKLTRPAIRLKRIPIEEAEDYLPPSLKNLKSKSGRKKRRKNLSTTYSSRKKTKKTSSKIKPLITTDESINKPNNNIRKSTRSKKVLQSSLITSVSSIQSTNDKKTKNKRKLRAIDGEDDDLFIVGSLSQTENSKVNDNCDQVSRYLGQNGILSQTRKANETTTTTTIYDDDDDDYPFPSHSNQEKTKSSTNTTIIETVTLDDDISPIEDQQMLDMLDNHENDSLFSSLELTHDRTNETNSILNYNDCIEDITNDGVDPPPSSSSQNFDVSLTT